MEMIAAMVYKLVDGATPQDDEDAGWGAVSIPSIIMAYSGQMLMVYLGALLILPVLVILLRT